MCNVICIIMCMKINNNVMCICVMYVIMNNNNIINNININNV